MSETMVDVWGAEKDDEPLLTMGIWGVDYHSIPIVVIDKHEDQYSAELKIADIPEDIETLRITICRY